MATPLFILLGPTGSGKTKLAISLAPSLDAEIVSADSMAIYRGMDIGTAKPTQEERLLASHHLIDIHDPWETYSAGMFVEEASKIIEKITERGHKVLLVGGTSLYIKSLLQGIFTGPAANWELRRQWMARSKESLYEELCQVDYETSQKISPNDVRRIIRALEVFYCTGIPISFYRKKYTKPRGDYEGKFVGIQWDRATLYRRIEERVEKMIKNGLVEETERLLQLRLPLAHTASQAIGYKETIAAIEDKSLMPSLVETIKKNTRHFAKKQMTWLRRFPIEWVSAKEYTTQQELIEKILAIWMTK
jgi:tRNA dimethylallyltransferase